MITRAATTAMAVAALMAAPCAAGVAGADAYEFESVGRRRAGGLSVNLGENQEQENRRWFTWKLSFPCIGKQSMGRSPGSQYVTSPCVDVSRQSFHDTMTTIPETTPPPVTKSA